MDPYGLPVSLLVAACGVSPDTARRWKRLGRIPPLADRLIELAIAGELGTLAPAWSGFILRPDALWTPYGFAVRPGEISSLAYRFAQLAELQHALAHPEQWDLLELNDAADRRRHRRSRR